MDYWKANRQKCRLVENPSEDLVRMYPPSNIWRRLNKIKETGGRKKKEKNGAMLQKTILLGLMMTNDDGR